MDGSSDGRSPCEVLGVERPDLDRIYTYTYTHLLTHTHTNTNTRTISLPYKHSHLTHTPVREAAVLPLVTQSAVTGHGGR